MTSIVNASIRAAVEGFTNPGGAEAYRQSSVYTDALASILAFAISVIIVSLVGLALWNYSVVPLFEFARPAKSVFQILGLMLFWALVRG
jgi:type IV secretory pathway TrbD component